MKVKIPKESLLVALHWLGCYECPMTDPKGCTDEKPCRECRRFAKAEKEFRKAIYGVRK